MAPEKCEVPISIVAVNHIEVIDHINWLHNELNIYGGEFEPFISSKIFAPTLAQEIKKGFLNPPIRDMPITEENGRGTIGAS